MLWKRKAEFRTATASSMEVEVPEIVEFATFETLRRRDGFESMCSIPARISGNSAKQSGT